MSLTVALGHHFVGFTLEAAFEAPPGLTALFGRSGSGKTTIVNAVAGLLRPERGRIESDGMVLLDTERGVNLPVHRRRIGYVFQEGRLFPHLTVRQNLTYGRWFAPRGEAGADFDRIVELLGIGALLERRPAALSGGEKSRVALGRAILAKPRMLLMDEPLAALDEQRKAEILPYLERLRDETRLPILYVSHSPAEVARLATTVVLLNAGKVTRAGPVADVLADPAFATQLGVREAGAVLTVRLAAHEADGLSRLETQAGPLFVPRVIGSPGTALRVRILAQDVMLALDRPERISALNVLPATVREIRMGDGPGAMVQLRVGDEALLARVTRRSVEALALVPGLSLYATIKAVAVAPSDISDH